MGDRQMTLKRRVAVTAAATLMSLTASVFFISGSASANTCSVTPKAGVSAVAIRGNMSVDGTPDAYLYSGQWIGSACYSEPGGYYSACGGSSYWIWVKYGILSRWVAAACVRMAVDRG
jgi:hypothetical protein